MDKKEFPFPIVSAFSIGYITLCGILWHLGYWSTFNFNFLEFASISDLFKATISPFLSRSWYFFALILMSFGLTNASIYTLRISGKYKSIDLNEPDKFVNNPNAAKWIDLMIFAFATLGGLSILSFGSRYLIFDTITTSLSLSFIFLRFGLFEKYFNSDIYRIILIFSITIFACLYFSIAKTQSMQTKMRFRYKKISAITAEDSTIRNSVINNPYLGSTANFTFILNDQNQVTTINNDQIKLITIVDVIVDSNYQRWLDR